MSAALLLDTRAWAWSLTDDPRLSARARSTMEAADDIYVSPISFFEIAQKVRIGKWPEMAIYLDRLGSLLIQQGGGVAVLEPAICIAAGTMTWSHRNPFDRLLAATTLYYGYTLLSADTAFDGIVDRVW